MSDSTRDRNVRDVEDEPSKAMPSRDETTAEHVAEPTPAGRQPMRSSIGPNDPSMRQPVDSEGWRELSDVEQRFHELEAEFIREPKAAVKKAETLVEEAVERITRQLHDEVARMHGHAKDSSDTEQLRVAMLKYKTLIESIRGRRAA